LFLRRRASSGADTVILGESPPSLRLLQTGPCPFHNVHVRTSAKTAARRGGDNSAQALITSSSSPRTSADASERLMVSLEDSRAPYRAPFDTLARKCLTSAGLAISPPRFINPRSAVRVRPSPLTASASQ